MLVWVGLTDAVGLVAAGGPTKMIDLYQCTCPGSPRFCLCPKYAYVLQDSCLALTFLP